MNRNDILWSERRSEGIIEDIFPDFLTFFIPDAPQQIDFEQEFLSTRLSYQFNTYKILNQSSADLEASDNPFAVVVLTVLAALKKKQVYETELLTLKLDVTGGLNRAV